MGFPFFRGALPWGLQSQQLWVLWITTKQNKCMSLRTFESFESVALIGFKIGADNCPLVKDKWPAGHAERKHLLISDVLRSPGQKAGKEGEAKPKAKPLLFAKDFLPRFKFEVVVHMLGEFGSCNANPGFNFCLHMCAETMLCCKAMAYMPFRVVISVVCLVAGSQRHRFCANFRFAIST